MTICFYGNSLGSNAVHREILAEAREHNTRLYFIAGDVVSHTSGADGRPDAVFDDYRAVFSTPESPLKLWPYTPGPVVFAVPGGSDEQYFLPRDVADFADVSLAGRSAYEGSVECGVRLFDAFYLEQMRLRVQPLTLQSKPLPKSPFGDYLLIIGTGTKREAAVLAIYRTDRWAFQSEQISWIDSTVGFFRAESPSIPLIAIAHDAQWYHSDSLDDGTVESPLSGVRSGSAQNDLELRERLAAMLVDYRVDLALAADNDDYSASIAGGLLRMNTGAASPADSARGRSGVDNLWIEYTQTDSSIQINVHPAGKGLRPAAAASGLAFEKHRSAESVWRDSNP